MLTLLFSYRILSDVQSPVIGFFFRNSCFSREINIIIIKSTNYCSSQQLSYLSQENYQDISQTYILSSKEHHSEEIYFCGSALNIYDNELINTISREANKVRFNKVKIVNRTHGEGKIKEEDLKGKKDLVSGLLRHEFEKIEFINTASC